MMRSEVVRAQVDAAAKKAAEGSLTGMGLSISDAIRILFVRIALDGVPPFEIGSHIDKAVKATARATVRARIDAVTKERAENTLVALGLSATDVIRVLFYRIAVDGDFPFDIQGSARRARQAQGLGRVSAKHAVARPDRG